MRRESSGYGVSWQGVYCPIREKHGSEEREAKGRTMRTLSSVQRGRMRWRTMQPVTMRSPSKLTLRAAMNFTAGKATSK